MSTTLPRNPKDIKALLVAIQERKAAVGMGSSVYLAANRKYNEARRALGMYYDLV